MKILHTSDWHLGRTLEGRSRIPEQRLFIDELCAIVDENGINLILIAGDVFDTYNPPAEAEALFYEAVERLAGNGLRGVVAIAGNHDSPDRLHAANPIAQKHGIYLYGYPGEELTGSAMVKGGPGWAEIAVPGCSEHALVVVLPYPSEQRLNEILSGSLEDKDMQLAYSERVKLAFSEGAAHFRDDTVNLAVSHLFVLGGRASESEREIQLGGAYVVEPAALPANAHYVALGHLHRPQKVGGSPVPSRYSGSPLCYSFSEADRQKEVVIIDAFPGKIAEVGTLCLTSGKPLRSLRFSCYQEAYSWCESEENRHLWADMEIASAEPLTASQVVDIRKLHPGVISIRVLLPGVSEEETGNVRRLSELSAEEKFRRFAARETGAFPEQELVEMFLELLEGGDADAAGDA
ncbi:metallophosphoesterase family protein [Phosphitispora fastidiosa]|uniref:metallophosphoesterase family protein n=1 Tax=Phosphitispora fastidiosa TaxID=2837202 RepID=UPI001E290FCC|nr:exonuclease subunit SbcD [Phosphitispora fastidiosa]MBU7005380.1 exonuclease SbcD [Phosphitispora fastidiosa]